MSKYKFDGTKYVTAGISNELSEGLTMFLWDIVEERKRDEGFEMDYLQVFQLVIEDGKQIVIHSQEQPEEYEKEYYPVDVPLTTAKIYVIDDFSHVTMLFAHEY